MPDDQWDLIIYMRTGNVVADLLNNILDSIIDGSFINEHDHMWGWFASKSQMYRKDYQFFSNFHKFFQKISVFNNNIY